MQLIAVGNALTIQPRLVVEADGIDDERIAIPRCNGITHPERVHVFGMTTSVEEELTIAVHVALHIRVWIHPCNFRHSFFDGDGLVRIVFGGKRMMRRHRPCAEHQAECRCNPHTASRHYLTAGDWTILHSAPPMRLSHSRLRARRRTSGWTPLVSFRIASGPVHRDRQTLLRAVQS